MRKNKVSKKSQSALDMGLVWLAKTQERDGSWRTSKYNGGNHDIAATSLAQLAFLGHGHSSKMGKYRKNVRASEKYLINHIDKKTGRIGNFKYTAAITLMAMAEAWGMSGNKKLKKIVQRQVDDAVKYQATNGGWGYKPLLNPKEAHVDTSVSGWWVMGLKSAKVAGAKVPKRTWENAKKYFRSMTKPGKGGVVTTGYTAPGSNPNLTAVSLTCLQFLGLPRRDPLVKGQAEFFIKNPGFMINPKFNHRNAYYAWYYQALGLFQMGTKSKYWSRFNKKMQRVMVDCQIKKGRNKGAWPVKLPWQSTAELNHFATSVGMVGTTAVSCLILEVFYRYEDTHKSRNNK